MKKVLALVAVLTMLVSMNAYAVEINTGSMFPVVKEPVSMSMAILKGSSAGNPSEMWFFTNYEAKTNVHWDVTQIDGSIWADKKTILLASGDYPDVFFGPTFTNSELMKYGAEGIFIPLNSLIDQYATNLQKVFETAAPQAKAAIACPDGNIYSMPYFSIGNIWSDVRLWIHESWLNTLGLKMPETLDDFYDALVAFKDKDPNGNGKADEIPWSGSWKEWPKGNQVVFYALGFLTDGSNVAMKDGQAVYMPLHKDYYRYLEFMKKCWDAGLIDPDIFTQTNAQYRAKSVTNVVGYAGDAAPFLMTGYEKTYEEYAQIKPLVADAGATPVYWHSNTYGLGNMEVTDACKTPEAAIRWVDIFYNGEQSFLSTNGPLYGTADDPNGIGWEIKDGAPWCRWMMDEEYAAKVNPDKLGPWDFFCHYVGPRDRGNPWYIGLDDAYALKEGYGLTYSFEDGELAWRTSHMDNASPYFQYGLPLLFFSDADNQTINELWTPLEDYVKAMEAKFITGAAPLSDYDDFVAELKNLGAEKIDEIYRNSVK